jgi:hypothetical protein
MADPVGWYESNADAISRRYEQVAPENIHGWLLNLFDLYNTRCRTRSYDGLTPWPDCSTRWEAK